MAQLTAARHRRSAVVALCVPIIGGDRVLGTIILEDHERENAFGEAEVRLLAHGGGEHGRGARERAPVRRDAAPAEGDRAAPPSWRSSTASSRAWPRSSTSRRIVDLVGDKLREVFDTGDMSIRWLDETGRIRCTSSTPTSTACAWPAPASSRATPDAPRRALLRRAAPVRAEQHGPTADATALRPSRHRLRS